MICVTVVFGKLVNRKGFEPLTHSLEGCCSIQLSYRSCYYKVLTFKKHIYQFLFGCKGSNFL